MSAKQVKEWLKQEAETHGYILLKYDGRQQYFHLQGNGETILGFCYRKADRDYTRNRIQSAIKYGTRI